MDNNNKQSVESLERRQFLGATGKFGLTTAVVAAGADVLVGLGVLHAIEAHQLLHPRRELVQPALRVTDCVKPGAQQDSLRNACRWADTG